MYGKTSQYNEKPDDYAVFQTDNAFQSNHSNNKIVPQNGVFNSNKNFQKLQIETKNDNDDVDDKSVTWFNIFCFAFAGLTFQCMFSANSVFATKFILDEAKISAKYSSVILFISRAIDAITDPIYGHFVNVTPMTRFGKLKPW